MAPFPYEEFDLSDVKTYPLHSRKSKAHASDFARPYVRSSGITAFLQGLPRILAAADFSAVVDAARLPRRNSGGVIWGLGAHVIKTGLTPTIVDLMERGFVSAI